MRRGAHRQWRRTQCLRKRSAAIWPAGESAQHVALSTSLLRMRMRLPTLSITRRSVNTAFGGRAWTIGTTAVLSSPSNAVDVESEYVLSLDTKKCTVKVIISVMSTNNTKNYAGT